MKLLKYFSLIIMLVLLALLTGCEEKEPDKTVYFYGWGGDEKVNSWLDGYVKDNLKERYNIKFVRVGMNIDDIISLLSNEKMAGKEDGDINIIWINGANFSLAKELEILQKIDTSKIPNYKDNIAEDEQYLYYDFETEIENFEVPFGKAQFVFIGNGDKVDSMPKTAEELLKYAKENPETFTYPAAPDFTGNAFVRNICYSIVGYDKISQASEDKEELRSLLMPAFDYLNELEPYLWQNGATYPKEESMMQKMYSDGILNITMSYTALIGPRNIIDGKFSPSSETFVFNDGNIGNSHYLAIPCNSPNLDDTYKVLNFILSAEAQASKLDINNWGDLPIITYDKLDQDEKQIMDKVYSNFDDSIVVEKILENSQLELSAKKTVLIEELWGEEVLNK